MRSQRPASLCADDDADIMALVEIADIVVSDGSNVLYEGVLAGTPGVCVTDWPLAEGARGELSAPPRVVLPGVVSGGIRSIPSMLQVVQAQDWRPLVAEGSANLVEPATRGRAAVLAADASRRRCAGATRSPPSSVRSSTSAQPTMIPSCTERSRSSTGSRPSSGRYTKLYDRRMSVRRAPTSNFSDMKRSWPRDQLPDCVGPSGLPLALRRPR